MNKEDLNQKVWYRALKVVFVILFLFGQTIGFVVTTNIANNKISFVRCDNGKEFKNPYFWPDDKEKLSLFKQCDITAYFFNSSEVEGILSDEKTNELDETILQMKENGSLESEIQAIVDDFKTKFAYPNPEAGKKYTTEELTKIWGHDLSDSFRVKDGNWMANFKLEDKDKNTLLVKIAYYGISFLIVSVFFWLITRIFFYVFAKEKFFKLPTK